MRRWVLGTLVGFVGTGVACAAMVPGRHSLSLATPALVLAVPVVAGVAIGGLVSGTLAVIAGFVAYDLLFIPPYDTLSVGAAQNWVALGVYVVVMLIVARVVAFLQHTRTDARRDAEATRRLYALSDLLIGDQPVTRVLQVIATTIAQEFEADWSAVLIPAPDGEAEGLRVAATAGRTLSAAELTGLGLAGGRTERLNLTAPRALPLAGGDAPAGGGIVRVALTARGRPIGMVAMAGVVLDRSRSELLQTYANHAAIALERSQLREQALRTELLEQVDQLRASLMGAVSHDLRTPLASVKAAVTALTRAEADGSLATHDRCELLELIEQQSDALDRLVANLLDMTRIQSGALEPRREITPLADVVEGAMRASAVGPEQVIVDLAADLPPVDVDQVLMEQVVANLLDNAARHSPDGAKIRLVARRRASGIELSVEDEGHGIPPEDRERVFTMFSRISGAGRAGLGLAIAKAFVEAHGERIWVEDAPEGGARFVLTLRPAHVPAEA